MTNPSPTAGPSGDPSKSWAGLAVGAVIVVVVAIAAMSLFRRSPRPQPEARAASTSETSPPPTTPTKPAAPSPADTAPPATTANPGDKALPPEQRVARGLEQFVGERRRLLTALAQKAGVEVPADVTRFFDLLQAGNLSEARPLFYALSAQRNTGDQARVLQALFPAIEEAFGATEISQKWPAKDLVAYGEAVLGALRPGMIYVSGSEAGRYIPALMDHAEGADRRLVVSRHWLSDGAYQEYLGLLSGGRIAPLTTEDTDRAFVDYVNDAKERALHDRKFPNEPARLRPGEDVVVDDFGRVQVSGPGTLAAIAELQVKAFAAKNAGVGFALEELSGLPYLRADAIPAGPVWEISPGAEAGTETAARKVAEYWQTTSERVLAGLMENPEGNDAPAGGRAARDAWARLAASQGSLLAEQNQAAAAEEVLHLAAKLAVAEAGPVLRYAEFLDRAGRRADLEPFLVELAKQGPDQKGVVESVRTQLKLPASP